MRRTAVKWLPSAVELERRTLKNENILRRHGIASWPPQCVFIRMARIAMQAIDLKFNLLLEAKFSGTDSVSAYLRGDALSFRAEIPIDTRRKTMNKFKTVCAAAILSLTLATPVFAQAAIQEPGAFAFAYPNNDVLNGGRPTPAAAPNASIPELFGSGGPAIPSPRIRWSPAHFRVN
jgi:hypothetical protein